MIDQEKKEKENRMTDQEQAIHNLEFIQFVLSNNEYLPEQFENASKAINFIHHLYSKILEDGDGYES